MKGCKNMETAIFLCSIMLLAVAAPFGVQMAAGHPKIDGLLSSLRMKAYRRGLQDYEYCWMLKQAGKEQFANDIIRKIIPKALTEGSGTSVGKIKGEASASAGSAGKLVPWSTDMGDWYQMRKDLAAEIEKNTGGR